MCSHYIFIYSFQFRVYTVNGLFSEKTHVYYNLKKK